MLSAVSRPESFHLHSSWCQCIFNPALPAKSQQQPHQGTAVLDESPKHPTGLLTYLYELYPCSWRPKCKNINVIHLLIVTFSHDIVEDYAER